MNARVLKIIPRSDEYEEKTFGITTNYIWVKFSDLYEVEGWVGKFGFGLKNNCRVLDDKLSNNYAFILSGGT